MNAAEDHYANREQSQIKHVILRSYLGEFAHKILSWADGLVYVDGFAGPWQTADDSDFKDSSFGIALSELTKARNTWRRLDKDPEIECIFLESDPQAFLQLNSFCLRQKDQHITALNKTFEDAIPDLVKNLETRGKSWFAFFLIDPKGWKGFGLKRLAPLIRRKPSETLVNFMTGHIHRFIEAENAAIQESFSLLYNSDEFAKKVAGLTGQEREDAMMLSYAERLAEVGDYPFVSTALVQNPTRDRTHYHLIYATRRIEGIQVFKSAERKALKLAPVLRAKAKGRRQEEKTGQRSLFEPTDLPDTAHLEHLTLHFESQAATVMAKFASREEAIAYDRLYALAMRFPIVQEDFVRQWLAENGFQSSQPTRTPKPGGDFTFHRR